MKYRDVITIFVAVFFFLSIGYSAAVAKTIWFWSLPAILLILLIIIYYKLWK